MDKDTEDFIDKVLADTRQPVVVFALEWCEFCWSIRKFFKEVNIAYRAVELDSVEFQIDDRGRRIRVVLGERTSMKTIPQVFIAGNFVGGCTDTFDAWREGRIQPMLAANGITYDDQSTADPYSFLPAWLHSR